MSSLTPIEESRYRPLGQSGPSCDIIAGRWVQVKKDTEKLYAVYGYSIVLKHKNYDLMGSHSSKIFKKTEEKLDDMPLQRGQIKRISEQETLQHGMKKISQILANLLGKVEIENLVFSQLFLAPYQIVLKTTLSEAHSLPSEIVNMVTEFVSVAKEDYNLESFRHCLESFYKTIPSNDPKKRKTPSRLIRSNTTLRSGQSDLKKRRTLSLV